MIFAASFFIIFSRRPDAILNPQFWAEDGMVWYAEAYNQGIIYSLTKAEAGYFQTISRLVAISSQFFTLSYAPLIFNLSAIIVQILVAVFITSKRCAEIIPSHSARLFVAFTYLALPHSYEVHANLTNTQWHLALLFFLVIISKPNDGKLWKIFDMTVAVVSVLSGPFCLLLTPIAIIKYWQRREKWILVLMSVLLVGDFIQTFSLLLHERPTKAPLGASVKLFFRIIGRQIFFSSIFGQWGLIKAQDKGLWKDGLVILTNLCGFSLVIYTFIKSSLEIRLFILFSTFIVIGALLSPAASSNSFQWEVLSLPIVGVRYWFIPSFCVLISLQYLAVDSKHKAVKYLCCIALTLSFIGIVKDWQHTPFQDYEFQKYAREFETVPVGTEFSIPINPNWQMKLDKK